MGDLDTLMRLGFYKAPEPWLQKNLPQNMEKVLHALPQDEVDEIVMPEPYKMHDFSS